jgi:hypothetical protein
VGWLLIVLSVVLLGVFGSGGNSAYAIPPTPIPEPTDPPDPPSEPACPPASGLTARFQWRMAERYGIDQNGNGLTDLPNTFEYAHPTGFTVLFDATCAAAGGSPISAYDWEISGNGLPSPLHFSSVAPSVPNLHEGLYNMRLTVIAQNGATNSTTEPIYLKDWLIVSIGDSYGSGEGNPVRDQTVDWLGNTQTPPKWADGRADHKRCHRSTLAASSLAALSLERADPHSSVTYVSVACSGATINKGIYKDMFHPRENEFEGTGILGGYRGAEPPNPNDYNPANFLPSQLKQVSDIVGSRRIDVLSVSGGGNDALFAKILEECTIWENACHHDTELLDHVDAALDELPGRYDDLNAALIDQNPEGRGPLDVAKVYLTEYPNPAFYDDGSMCNEMINDVVIGRVINLAETQWLLPNVMVPLNDIGANAADAHGWRRVGGIGAAFANPGQYGHGYCATHTGSSPQSWIRTATESKTKQGPNSSALDTKGTMHPNERGHMAIGLRLQFYLCDSIADFTPVGAHACARPVDTVTRQTPATLTYGNVMLAGVSRLTISPTGPQRPAGYRHGTASNYYNFSTSASFSGGVEVCLTYQNSDFPNESGLRLFQYDNSAWADRTSSHDPANNRICGQAASPSTFSIFQPNRPPVVDAGGPYTVNEGATVTLSGTASDPDGDSLTYAWTSALPLSNPAILNPTVTGTDNTVQTLTLTARDPDWLSASDTATLTVLNVAPSASFSAPPANEGGSVAVSLTNPTDPSSADVTAGFSYAFDCGGGYGAYSAINTANCPAPNSGALAVKAKIKDKDNGAREYNASVPIANIAPAATFLAPTSALPEGSPFVLSLTNPSDPSPADVAAGFSYAFDCGAGYGAFGAANSANCTAANSGTLAVKGKIKDQDGGVREYSANVTVTNVAPIATFVAPTSAVPEGSPFVLSLTNPTDPSSGDMAAGFSYAFDCGAGYGAFGASASASCTPPDNGTLTVKGKIKDQDGGASEYSANVAVTNVAPTATFAAPAPVAEGSPFTLVLSAAADAAGDLPTLQYAFDCGAGYGAFGAGNTATCPTTDDGTFAVKGKVKDKDGGEREYNASATVTNVAPSATFVAPASVVEGNPLALSLTSPTDPSSGDVAAGFGYAFDCGAGYGAFTTNNTASCALDSGTRAVKGKIKDKNNGVREYTANVTVSNVAPSATFVAPASAAEGVAFNVSFSNPVDPSPADVAAGFHYAFACNGGSLNGATYANSGASATTACTLPDGPAGYIVRARIIDKDGGYSEYTASVAATNLAPSATFQAPDSVAQGHSISLKLLNAFDAPGDLPTLQYAFDCGDGKGYGPFSSSSSAGCQAGPVGLQVVRGQVKDKDGGVIEYTAKVTVHESLVVTITAPGDGAMFPANSAVDLVATFTDANILGSHTCQVNWGDEKVDDVTPTEGIGSGSCEASHEYSTPGQYNIKVTVTSSMGDIVTVGITIRIVPEGAM